jgi:hypothetical protein
MCRWTGVCGLLAKVSQPTNPCVTHQMLDYHEIGQSNVLHAPTNYQLIERRKRASSLQQPRLSSLGSFAHRDGPKELR